MVDGYCDQVGEVIKALCFTISFLMIERTVSRLHCSKRRKTFGGVAWIDSVGEGS